MKKFALLGLDVFLLLVLLVGCESLKQKEETDKNASFPILGRKEYVTKMVNGKEVTDTVDHTIPDYKFLNQDSSWITPADYEGQIYVADFFFTTCPTICPKMKKQMLRVYEAYKDNDEVGILSHTIDPEHDSVAVLHEFAEKLGVEAPKWNFVTGPKERIYEVGQKGYMVTAREDENELGGYIHSGAFVLVDKERKIRGIYDGTKAEDVTKLIQDIEKLLEIYHKADDTKAS
jgi:protein SCO1/2